MTTFDEWILLSKPFEEWALQDTEDYQSTIEALFASKEFHLGWPNKETVLKQMRTFAENVASPTESKKRWDIWDLLDNSLKTEHPDDFIKKAVVAACEMIFYQAKHRRIQAFSDAAIMRALYKEDRGGPEVGYQTPWECDMKATKEVSIDGSLGKQRRLISRALRKMFVPNLSWPEGIKILSSSICDYCPIVGDN